LGVAADRAGVFLGEVEADTAVGEVLLDVLDGPRELQGLVFRQLDQVEGQPFSSPRANAGQAFEAFHKS
jgi:hypothetical protein